MKEYKCYKVVDPSLGSACQNDMMPYTMRVSYKIGEFVGPNPEWEDSYLFAFADEKEAFMFAKSLGWNMKVYEAVGVDIKLNIRPASLILTNRALRELWKNVTSTIRSKKSLTKFYDSNKSKLMYTEYRSIRCFKQVKLVKRIS